MVALVLGAHLHQRGHVGWFVICLQYRHGSPFLSWERPSRAGLIFKRVSFWLVSSSERWRRCSPWWIWVSNFGLASVRGLTWVKGFSGSERVVPWDSPTALSPAPFGFRVHPRLEVRTQYL